MSNHLISCVRKIKLITPVRVINEISYCYVYTFQEKYEWGDFILDRSNEKMIATGDVAELLQLTDYVNNKIGLTYYYSDEMHQHVIVGFTEWDPNKYFWGDAGYLPYTVREFESTLFASYSNPIKKTKCITKYNANVFEYRDGHKRYPSGKRLFNANKKQLMSFMQGLEKETYIECEQIKQYGDYKTYHHEVIKIE